MTTTITTTPATAPSTGLQTTREGATATGIARGAGTEPRKTGTSPRPSSAPEAPERQRTTGGHTGWCGWTPGGWPCTLPQHPRRSRGSVRAGPLHRRRSHGAHGYAVS